MRGRERHRAEGQKLDQLAARARADGDTLVLEALGEVSKAIREQNLLAARSVSPQTLAPESKAQRQARVAKEKDVAVKERFHKLHTMLLAPANMMAQMTCAVIFFRPGPLLSEPTFAEGVRFFVYGGFGYMLPAVWLILFHWSMLTKDIRVTVAWIFLSVLAIAGILAWFEKQ